jgi:LPPG:FO 2-phospho-L-lactate transferase
LTLSDAQYVALSGGIGGAKLALGLNRILPSGSLTVIANTGDDFEHLGLYISPDTDTVMYTLAGISDRNRGWGREKETWNFMGAVAELGGESWFQLGDRDLATNVLRTSELGRGTKLDAVTAMLCDRLGVSSRIIPMSNDPVRTIVVTASGELSFQQYFVRDACDHPVTGFRFEGIESAKPAPGVVAALTNTELAGVVICPSNPFISIDPILAVQGIRELLIDTQVPVIGVSPIIQEDSIKGPTAKMMREMGISVSSKSIASRYSGILDGIVVDSSDHLTDMEAGMPVFRSSILMSNTEDKMRLAREVVRIISEI